MSFAVIQHNKVVPRWVLPATAHVAVFYGIPCLATALIQVQMAGVSSLWSANGLEGFLVVLFFFYLAYGLLFGLGVLLMSAISWAMARRVRSRRVAYGVSFLFGAALAWCFTTVFVTFGADAALARIVRIAAVVGGATGGIILQAGWRLNQATDAMSAK